MDVKKYFKGNYLRASDLQGELTLTISGCVPEERTGSIGSSGTTQEGPRQISSGPPLPAYAVG